MTRPRARILHKSGQNGKSGSGDTIGIRVPSEDALRKIAFNVASASGERGKKNARQERTNNIRGWVRKGWRYGAKERKRQRYELANRKKERKGEKDREGEKAAETTREGSVATLLMENSSALAILIKSWKSLARSIGQTGKARSVGSRFGNGHSQCAHFTQPFPPFALWLPFCYFCI